MPGGPPTRFVYLGPEGTFSEQALLTLPAAAKGTRIPARSVPEALDAVRGGDADAAVVPLENSIGGQVGVTLDELAGGAPPGVTPGILVPGRVLPGPPAPASVGGPPPLPAPPPAHPPR